MGKAALIAFSAFIIASSSYNLSTQEGNASALRATSKHQLTILARNAAITGYDRAKQMVADAGTLQPFASGQTSVDGEYSGATYTTTITSDGDAATIESVAQIGNGLDDVTYVVNAVIGWQASGTPSVPPFLTYALLSEESLQLNGNVNGYVDDPASEFNANFHTNGNLHVNGNAASVAGFGSYVGAGTSNPWRALGNTFDPHHNPDDLETVYRTAAVDMPTFDADEALAGAGVDRSDAGSVNLSGSISVGGTETDPYIWHVEGDLTASGGATIDGYVMFVVEGDADLSGNLIAGSAEDVSSVALYVEGEVSLSGNIQIHGTIYAEGDVTLSGTPDVYGSIASHSGVTLNGTPGIHYRPAAPALTSIFSDDSDLTLLSYFEH